MAHGKGEGRLSMELKLTAGKKIILVYSLLCSSENLNWLYSNLPITGYPFSAGLPFTSSWLQKDLADSCLVGDINAHIK